MQMNILVIDDSTNHQQAARQVLGEHNLTVVESYDGALKLLANEDDGGKLLLPYWDAVLCDLLMPAGRSAQGDKGLKYVGQEMPVGWSLAITAALRGAKYVAVVTDMNHHHHPASAMLDAMTNMIFNLHGAKALFTNHVRMVGIEGTQGICMDCLGEGTKFNGSNTYQCCTCRGTKSTYAEKGKDWAEILDRLVLSQE